MTLNKETGELGHYHFYDLPQFLKPGDCLVLNDSRVLPARLLGQREPTGGACEVVLLIDRGDNVWECLVRPGKKLRTGAKLSFGHGALQAEIIEVLENGNRLIRFFYEGIFLEILEELGRMPLPPYIKRSSRTTSGIRPSTPKCWGPPPLPPPACTSRRSCCARWRRWGSGCAM